MRHVVSFSGGVGSWATAKRVWSKHDPSDITLLVADTNTEAADWMPFVKACHANLTGTNLVILGNGGQDIWDVFDKHRFIGNTRADLCSRVLKREPLRAWLEEQCDPADTVVYLGFDWSEIHRFDRAKPHWEPWTIAAPLCEPPYLHKQELLSWLDDNGIPRPVLYSAGFPHNNCAGACVKGGQTQWRRLLYYDPETYAYHEQREEQFRATVNPDVAILRDRTGGDTTPLPLRQFRERLTADPALFDTEDGDACSCMDPGVQP